MVTVIGAGPAGLACARKSQELGWKTTIIEDHPTVGDPVACTGLISATGVDELRIRRQVEEVLVNKIKGAQIFSPNHEMIEIKRSNPVAYVIDRGKFDRVLAKDAVDAGAELKLNTKMIDIRNETIFTEYKGRGELLKSKIIVGADGVNSKTRGLAGISTNIKDFVHAYQVVAKGNFDPNYVQVYVGEYSKNFFAWIVPENEETARIGLASTSGNIRKDFNVFVAEKNISGEFCDMCSSLIPIGEPLKNIVKNNIMLVGDSAFQTKATTGGGIMIGMEAGRIAGQAINDHIKEGKPLKDYEKACAGINKELKIHWKVRQYLNNKNEDELDKLFRRMRNAKIGEFLSEHGDMDKPSRFIGKVLSKPSLWGMFSEALRFMST